MHSLSVANEAGIQPRTGWRSRVSTKYQRSCFEPATRRTVACVHGATATRNLESRLGLPKTPNSWPVSYVATEMRSPTAYNWASYERPDQRYQPFASHSRQ